MKTTTSRFAIASLIFGVIALMTWKWLQVGTVAAAMSVGFGIIAPKSKQRWMAVVGVLLGAAGLIRLVITHKSVSQGFSPPNLAAQRCG